MPNSTRVVKFLKKRRFLTEKPALKMMGGSSTLKKICACVGGGGGEWGRRG